MSYLLPKESLPKYLNSLKKKFEVIAPVKAQDGSTLFKELDGEEMFLDSNTVFPPKRFFLPEKEILFQFKKGKITEELDKRERVIFGLRSCDLHALLALDKTFLHYWKADPYYSARRANTILIALHCTQPQENCFCTSMGTSIPAGYDLLFTESGNNYYVEIGTEKGGKLINNLFKKTNKGKPAVRLRCRRKLETENLEKLLEKNFRHRIWEKEGSSCLNCTACTQVCPSCYCFEVKDEFYFNSGNSIRRRMPDSCQLKRFTEVAGGRVFRESRASRLRQFVNHNLLYYKKTHGLHKCVGCGRCINECPVDIDLIKICDAIRGKKHE